MIHDFALTHQPKCRWLRFALVTTLNIAVSVVAQTAPDSAAAASTPAAPPPTLEHQPAQLPSVTFQNGELTIVAYNSNLRDVLEMVRKQTGATIDIPQEATERVFVKLGPGPARHVLDQLLAGSNLNYVLLGSSTDPQALTKVVLTAKTSGNDNEAAPASASAAIAAAQRRSSGRRQLPVAAPPSEDAETAAAPIQQSGDTSSADETAANAAASAIKPETQDKVETASAGDPGSQPAANTASAAAANAPPSDFPRTPNIKTAQEVLQDLYARRAAMQQQQNQQSKPQ